jgi:hypothetical protein
MALILACFTVEGAVELKEDFSGDGQFQSFTDSGKVFDRAQGGALEENGNITYGRILSTDSSNSTLFSGFLLEGPGSYAVSSGLHLMRLSGLQRLNVTARISASPDEAYSRYSANGSGNVREKFLVVGNKSRPLELGSIYHAGRFEINSSLLWRA